MTAVLLETRAAIEEGLFDEGYLWRLRGGDDETARHFERYFRRRVRARVWNKFPRQRAADLVDDVMAAAMLSILRGEPANVGHLPAYVFGICSNLTRVAMRPKSYVEVPHANLDYFPDDEQTILDRLREAEVRQAVLEVLGTLRQRDREVLVDLFYNRLSRLEVSEKHGVTRDQLRAILFQALKKFKKKWETCGRYSV